MDLTYKYPYREDIASREASESTTKKREKVARKYFGYCALITSEKVDTFTALYLYRVKDVVEKFFGEIKVRLNVCRRLLKSEKKS